MFHRVLVANRGEIAVRIIRTLRRMGIESIAVHTDDDRGARHVEAADRAVPVRGRGYLDIGLMVDAARLSGAEAVHPGYGFLSENAGFARACASAGIAFVGPPAEAIELMGDKINAKRAVALMGVPVVPGRDEPGLDDAQLAEAALGIGLPVLLKPSAGGGGKGMRMVAEEAQLPSQIAAARREAAAAFGDATLLVERFVPRPRHIEMQVFADRFGVCVALGERECSLQRRHQKIVEEAPSPLLTAPVRAGMAASAVAAARACRYEGAGTVEFIVSADRPDEYFFMEMNTRLQVEHPVTEMVLGVDLVELQLRVAAGEHLPWPDQGDVPEPTGHAVEARVYAEDPHRGLLPSSGRVLLVRQPDGVEGIRVDSALGTGVEVGTAFDPMLAKVVAWGADRTAALRRLDRALAATAVLGVTTNVGFLRRLLSDPDVAAGDLDTELVERRLEGYRGGPPPDAVLVAAALTSESGVGGQVDDPWSVRDGWRLSGRSPRTTRWQSAGRTVEVALVADPARAPGHRAGTATVDGAEGAEFRAWPGEGGTLLLEMGGRTWSFLHSLSGSVVWIGSEGDAWSLARHEVVLGQRAKDARGLGRVTSPMPGKVVAVRVAEGQQVHEGDELVVVEAMKMEYAVGAPCDGVVADVRVRAGDSVASDQDLVVVKGGDEEGPGL